MISRADNQAPGDQQLVSITDYDQLGRVRLTRQLENASQNVEDDSVGIKVQTRYGFSGTQSYQAVSNPYRASTSAAASGESTMGWTLSAADWYRRASGATAYGASLPASPPTLACPTTGSQVTCYAGNTTTTTDEAGVMRTNTLDGLGRLAQVVENGISATTGYGYDSQGNLTSVMQSGVNGRSFVFDSLGRLTTAVNPESASTGYLYDNNGNLTKRTDGRGIASTYYYDALNRLTDKSYSDGTPGPHYQFAGGADFLTSVQSSASLYTWSNYDALGRPGAGSQMTNAQTWNFPSMVWTPQGQVASLAYPSGRTVSTTYDGAGRISGVTGVLNGTPTPYVSSVNYAAHGAPSGWNTGDGLSRSMSYTARLQTGSIVAGGALSLTFDWGAVGNNGLLQSQTIGRPGLNAVQTYGYDGVKRLTSALEGNWNQWYTYDKAGNRAVISNNSGQNSTLISPNDTPQTATAGSVPFDANNHWVMAGVPNDSAGNVTGVNTKTLAYDAESRMTSWANSNPAGGASFTYDGDGRRVTKTSGGMTTVYVYDPAGNLAVEAGGAAPSVNGTLYLTADQVGSVRLVTNGVGCVGAHDYLPFGEEIPSTLGRTTVPCYGATDTTWKYGGQQRDAETGLDNFLARHMAPPQGRFLSPDPLGNFVADLRDPQSWNLYSYVRNKPLTYVDPSGLDAILPCVNGVDPKSGFICVTGTSDGGGGSGYQPICFLSFLCPGGSTPGGGGGNGNLGTGGGGGGTGKSPPAPAPSTAKSNLTPPNPCLFKGNAMSPGQYAAIGAAAAALGPEFFLGISAGGFPRGSYLDAQPSASGNVFQKAAYGNYSFGVYMASAGVPYGATMAAANTFAMFSHYTAKNGPIDAVYTNLPNANVINITNGFNAFKDGTTCHQ